jgi:hypothetical protein
MNQMAAKNAIIEQISEKRATAASLRKIIVIDGAKGYPPKYPDSNSPYA